MAIRFFDMFSGIGGFRAGLEAIGGFECVGHCEIDKYANQAYNAIYEPKGELYAFLRDLSEEYPIDIILLCCDGAAWHKSGALEIPENIELFHIPPYTPEINPIEQIWKEIRKRGFRNEAFASLAKVMNRLCDTICSLTNDVVSSITGRDWIVNTFN